jgi:aminoglycoside 6-adenylyltransferase
MASLHDDPVIQRLIQWGEEHDTLRAMILTSTRTSPTAHTDAFSDYDVVLALTDIGPFVADRAWLEDFGRVLVLYQDPVYQRYGADASAYVTQYEDGLKIDFILWQAEILPRLAADPVLPPDFDVGYTVLLDKDGLTAGLKPPTFSAYIPKPPTEAEYNLMIELFFHEATYAAKNLWREELMPAKYFIDQDMKQDHLLPMLEWRMEMDNGWSVKTGIFGKGLKKRLPPEIWAELEGTYAGAGMEENWEAMMKTIALFRRMAIEVGDRLGYAYPHELDRRMMAYLQKVKNLDRQAKSFSDEQAGER